jgi:predicted O-methyltransferase YrrM
MTEQELLYASTEDIAFFNECTKGLPESEVYSCGAHSVRCLREIVDIVKPKFIFEIGFNVGKSASLWLNLAPEAKLISIDISEREELFAAVMIMTHRYNDRFSYFDRNRDRPTLKAMDIKADLAFIDGSHEMDDVCHDIGLVISLGIPYIAFDDILPQYGEVQDAINWFPELEIVKTMGNIALYKNANTTNNDLL